MGTLILLGAETSNGTSSAFLFVPDGASELSRSMGSMLGKPLTNINGRMVAVFKRALHKEALVMQFIIRSKGSRNETTTKIQRNGSSTTQVHAMFCLFTSNMSSTLID